LRRSGAPDSLYLDNGHTYSGETLRIACERLGVTLIHAKPYDAPARGKMERFWRTLREGCLDQLGTMASLHEVQARLVAFLDEHYHQAPHGGLLGKRPGRARESLTRPSSPRRSPSRPGAASARTAPRISPGYRGSSIKASWPDVWSASPST
jgi:putative transposase